MSFVFSGFLAFLSTEASGLFLCLMTIDRIVTIRFTLKKIGFSRSSALWLCFVVWVFSTLLAALPFSNLRYFDNEFYTK